MKQLGSCFQLLIMENKYIMSNKNGKPTNTVAGYITHQLAIAEKTQKEVSNEIGYRKPNMITMFKQGQTKIPLNKIGPLAAALGVDPVHLLRMALREYLPDSWEVISKYLGGYLVTQNELKILEVIQEAADGINIVPKTESDKTELKALITKWREREILEECEIVENKEKAREMKKESKHGEIH